MKRRRIAALLTLVIPVLAWLFFWEILVYSSLLKSSVLPTPTLTIKTMFARESLRIIAGPLVRTFSWTLIALIVGIGLGFTFVIIGNRFQLLSNLLSPIFVAGRTLPSVIAIPIFATTFGIDRNTVSICSIFLCLSYSFPTLEQSVRSTLVARRTFRNTLGLTALQSFWVVLLPGMASAIRAIGVQSLGIALVVTLAGEMILSLENSLGRQVAEFAWLLQMAQVYAIVGWLLILSSVLNSVTYALPTLFSIPAKRLITNLEKKIHQEHF